MDSSMISFQKVKKYTIYTIKILSFVFAAICLVCGVVPLVFYFHLNPGNVALIIYAALLLFVLTCKTNIVMKELYIKILKICKIAMASLLVVCFLIGIIVSVYMIKYAFYNQPSDAAGSQGTVVVLGCKINGEQPSDSLRGRLDKAYEYLESHKEAVAIVSGGTSWGGEVSESYVMKKYLIEKGISPERIFEENKSMNTDENILFSREIISEYNLPKMMYIITDTFHSYRAYLFAEKNGCEAKNISADIYLPFFGEYWVRDILGVLHMKLTPNWELDIQNS